MFCIGGGLGGGVVLRLRGGSAIARRGVVILTGRGRGVFGCCAWSAGLLYCRGAVIEFALRIYTLIRFRQ